MTPSAARRSADVVVVGAGAVGLACATELAAAGLSVVLLESGRAGSGASYGNAGHFTPSDCVPLASPGVLGQSLRWLGRRDAPLTISTRFARSEWRWLLSFALACRSSTLAARMQALASLGRLSADTVREREDDLLSRTGVVELYETRQAFAHGRSVAAQLGEHGIRAQPCDADELRGGDPLVPDTVVGGVRFPDDGVIDPAAFVARLRDRALRVGVDVREGAHVSDIVRCGGHVRGVVSDGAMVAACTVVLAAGAAVAPLAATAGLRLPVASGRGYSLDVGSSIGPRTGLLFVERRIAVTPLAGRVRFAGMMDLVHDDGFANRFRRRRLAQLDRQRREAVPRLRHSPATTAWSGARPCTADGVPAIGATSIGGLFAAAGHGMLGMTLARGTGRLLCELVLGAAPSIDPAPYSPTRFTRSGFTRSA